MPAGVLLPPLAHHPLSLEMRGPGIRSGERGPPWDYLPGVFAGAAPLIAALVGSSVWLLGLIAPTDLSLRFRLDPLARALVPGGFCREPGGAEGLPSSGPPSPKQRGSDLPADRAGLFK